MPQAGIEPPDIGAKVYHSANQAIPDDTLTSLAFDTEVWDTDTIHDIVTNNSRLTCKTAGKYVIMGTATFVYNATGERALFMVLNGTLEIAVETTTALYKALSYTKLGVSTIYNMAVGDYIELVVRQSSGNDLNVYGGSVRNPDFVMQRIG